MTPRSSIRFRPEPATSKTTSNKTDVGSVFVSNYPPYSFWRTDYTPQALAALKAAPKPGASLGLYLHIPFCRKRCKFCYFKVYVDKNSEEIRRYLDALSREVRLYAQMPAIAGRKLKFVYFGGGTPSFISALHLKQLVRQLKQEIPWEGAEEVTFECEPGTLTEAKLEAIRRTGVTRLSLGIENFDDRILEENGRAHHSKEIWRVIPWIKDLQFEQLNVDLIAGMLGESWETWRETVRKTIEIDPDSVTVYQMELPFNTRFSADLLGGKLDQPVADWETKRDWHDYAFEQFEQAGYRISSAYTVVKKDKNSSFVYRDAVWHGTDMIGTGVASFSHMSGVHFQNVAVWEQYFEMLERGEFPLDRAFVPTPRERMTREMILQLKLGELDVSYFQKKFATNIVVEFQSLWLKLQKEGFLTFDKRNVRLKRTGLLRVDQLLPEFYDEKYRNARYT